MMAGTVSLRDGKRWSAAGWLFDWVVQFLADNVEEPGLRSELRQIVDENLGWLGLGDFGGDAERAMRELLRHRLVPAAEAAFAQDMGGREGAIELLRELAREV